MDLEDTLKFFGMLSKLAAQDAIVHKLFLEVQNLLKPRSAFATRSLLSALKKLWPKRSLLRGESRNG